jgi:hypothetical protein
MTWQAHDTGHAPSPPLTGRDEGEDTQVELVLLEHSFEQVELTAILFLTVLDIFNILASIENKRTSLKLLILCVIILNLA